METTTSHGNATTHQMPSWIAGTPAQHNRAPRWQEKPADIGSQLGGFAPISLAQMDGVALQDRIDTKYVLRVEQLGFSLAALAAEYQILEIAGTRLQRYRTLYFDTEDFDLYRQHHAGYRIRYKVRSRQYCDTNLACLEVKQKTGADRTTKQRLPTSQLITSLHSETGAFLGQHLPVAMPALEPKLWNTFGRITLLAVTAELRDGPVTDALLEAIAGATELVVMSTHGRGPIARFWIGSTTDALVRERPVPLLLVCPTTTLPPISCRRASAIFCWRSTRRSTPKQWSI